MCALACLLQSLPWPRRSCLNLLTLQCARQQKYRHPSLSFRDPCIPPHVPPATPWGHTDALSSCTPPYPPWFLPQGVRERERGDAPRHTHAHTVQDLHLSSTAHRESWHARTTPHRQLTGWTVVACCCPAPVNTLVGNRTPTAGPCLLL